jgi:hypothetical protein
MGQLTRAQIVTQALSKAGADATALTTLANTWLNTRLRTLYASWPWPFLHRPVSAIPLAAGTTALVVGAGSGGITNEIKRILDPLYIYDSAYTTKGKIRIRALLDETLDMELATQDTALNRGRPELVKVVADSALWGRWNLIPYPVPDKAYLLKLDYIEQPADINTAAGGDAVKPIYPSDRTLVAAVVAEILAYDEGLESPAAAVAEEEYGALAVQDRVRYGEVFGTNDQLGLDGSVFRKK